MMTLSIDRVGALPMHSSARFRPMIAAMPWTFGSGSKGVLTEVMVTVL